MEISKRKLVQSFVLLSAIIFIVILILRRIQSSYNQLEGNGFIFNGKCLVAMAMFVLAVLASSLLWGLLIEKLTTKHLKLSSSIEVHLVSWLLKYIPGQVGSYLWKLKWGAEQGFSKVTISTAFIYENILLGISSTLYTIPVILFALGADSGSRNYIFIGCIVAFIFTIISYQPVLKWVICSFCSLIKREVNILNVVSLDAKQFASLQVMYIVPRVLNATGFILIVYSIQVLSVTEALLVGATYVLAGIIGMLAIFVPSGIGVREGVIVIFLSGIMPVELSVVAAINARIYATLSDIVLGIVYTTLKYKLSRT